MADQNTLIKPFNGLSQMPIVRQGGLLIGLALSVALGIGLVSWSQEPNYVPFLSDLPDRELAPVVAILDAEKVKYRLQGSTIAVPADKIHSLRIKLASQGLPKGGLRGFDLLEEEQSFGTSSFLETARYNRALEGELSKSIATLDGVNNSRVHLAIPKQSAFLRNKSGASASVLVSLYPGSRLADAQIAGIVHLVASSVPNMETDSVSVVNQKGELLTLVAGSGSTSLAASAEQRGYARSLEADYSQRIISLLAPIVGTDRVRAQVSADMDFTTIERTSEVYGSDNALMRSEQTSEERSTSPGAFGVPGALSNQPPPAGAIGVGDLDPAVTNPDPTAEAGGVTPERSSKQETKNYELDRTISHINEMSGTIQRLSIAVVLDYRDEPGAGRGAERVPFPDDEIQRYTLLIQEAVGFNSARGDSINIINAPFMVLPEPEAIPEIPVWKQPWVFTVGKQLLAIIGVALLVFGVLRPVMKSLANYTGPARVRGAGQNIQGLEAPAVSGELVGDDQVTLSGAGGGGGQLPGTNSGYDRQVAMAQTVAREDPRRAAQVVKGWVAEDE
jgi:flagellar M-ring protein FliF